MTHENYILYLKGTIDTYPSKTKKHINKLFTDADIVKNTSQLSLGNVSESAIDVKDLELTEKIKTCLAQNKEAIKLFEEWEFTKDYKYSVVFTCENFQQLLNNAQSLAKTMQSPSDESAMMFEYLKTPITFDSDGLFILKFNLKFAAIDPLNENEIFLKYPVLIVLHKESELIELRFDVLKRVFIPDKKEQSVYSDLIDDIIRYVYENLNTDLVPLDLDYLVSEVKQDSHETRVMAEYRKLPSGGNAQLEVGNNQEYVLPIIGELKELIKKHQTELEQAPILKEALEQFIFENDELSDYSWIELMWENEIKTRSIRAKFIFNYRNKSYCLIQHYFNNVLIGMERMNHVIDYINAHRNITANED
ncbi:MAG: hypothetical protein ACLR23_07910 [Clostridia bacterium]|jgi:hypothetical protein|uniref:Uncharacterized protein n=1 Tax=Bianquea renquensis TaxID=2763661 RepID=A0A926HZY4_9FIRM|nr:hypothetical protein [Bianquea renquensis]MBC8542614.1 hypothetical protein [Bianquea renquensis]